MILKKSVKRLPQIQQSFPHALSLNQPQNCVAAVKAFEGVCVCNSLLFDLVPQKCIEIQSVVKITQYQLETSKALIRFLKWFPLSPIARSYIGLSSSSPHPDRAQAPDREGLRFSSLVCGDVASDSTTCSYHRVSDCFEIPDVPPSHNRPSGPTFHELLINTGQP